MHAAYRSARTEQRARSPVALCPYNPETPPVATDPKPPPLSLADAAAQADATKPADDPPPPKPAAGKKSSTPRKRKRTTAPRDRAPAAPRPAALERRIRDFIESIGALVLIANVADGTLIVMGAEQQAAALNSLANENATVKRALETMLAASAWGAVVTAFAPTLIGIAANHGALPAPLTTLFGGNGAPGPGPGIVPPLV